jgi:hypothetical protein
LVKEMTELFYMILYSLLDMARETHRHMCLEIIKFH